MRPGGRGRNVRWRRLGMTGVGALKGRGAGFNVMKLASDKLNACPQLDYDIMMNDNTCTMVRGPVRGIGPQRT